MIQILGLRTWVPKEGKNKGKETKYDAFFDKNWRARSVKDLFSSLEKYLEPIPEDQRWNLFYTLANCGEGKREFQSQSVLAFDIDGINTDNLENYVNCFCAFLQLRREDIGIVFSGNGLHFLIGLKNPYKKNLFQ